MAWNGNRLREIRKAAGLNQTQLADAADCDQTAVSLWELDKRVPGTEELFRLADALNVNCDAFRQDVGADIAFKRRPKKKPE